MEAMQRAFVSAGIDFLFDDEGNASGITVRR